MTSAMDLAQKPCSLEILCISSMKSLSKTEVVMMMVLKGRGAKVGISMAAILDWAFFPVYVFDGAGFMGSLGAKFFGNILPR